MPFSIADLGAILGAVVLAAIGGEAFLKGILGTAAALRLPRLLVATTLAAFATSSPELTVSLIAAMEGKPEIGLGDAIGSNVVNIALIFGLAVVLAPIKASRRKLGRDFVLAVVAPILTFWLASDNAITRSEGMLLLTVFAGWMLLVLRDVKAYRVATRVEIDDDIPGWGALAAYGIGGLAALIVAARLFVSSASGIATTLGIDAYIIGATVVAVGTSLPELVTVILARLRGHDEVGIGTLLGSNLFNGLAIVGIAASIHPIHVPLKAVAVTLVCGIAALLLLVPNRDGLIPRGRGIVLLTLYAAFVGMTAAS